MAGIGMDAPVVASVNPVLKKALKEAAFAVQGAVTTSPTRSLCSG